MFANDIQLLYHQIDSLSDCLLLQTELHRIIIWGESLGLSINIQKCSPMTFSSIKDPLHFSYSINDVPLKCAGDSIHDLGFTLTRTLYPLKHIEETCCKALKILGFVFRVTQEFRMSSTLKAPILLLPKSF